MDVDPLKFRLRAFEHNFVKPIIFYLEREPLLEQRAQATPFWQTVVAGAQEPEQLVDHDAPASIGLMQASLLAEAAEWIRIGSYTGYFSTEIPLIPITFGGIDLYENRNLFLFMSGTKYNYSGDLYTGKIGEIQRRFADDLTVATEQLDDNDGHMELTRLLHFATKQEWARRFGMLEELASTLERRPDVSFSDGVMGQMRWAFFEGNLASYAVGPSSWRNATRLTSPGGGLAEERYNQLKQIRGRIAAAAESIGPEDGSTAMVLLASALQTERRRGRDRSDPPLMFSRLEEQAHLRPSRWVERWML